jgi:hypothetical protein
VLSLLAAGTLMAQGRQSQIIVGKTGVFTLPSVTKVGTLTLQPGRYLLQHRDERRGGHTMHFVGFSSRGIEPSQRFEQKCKVEPLPAKATRTRIFLAKANGEERITKIEIKGENVAHVF